MSRLVVGNQLTVETVEGERALPEDYLSYLAAVTHRLLWCAEANDVVLLPTAPDEDFAQYVWGMLGIRDAAPAIVVPPPGRRGTALLYNDRLEDAEFLAGLRKLARDRGVDSVRPFYFDAAIDRLAAALGLADPMPGYGFLAEGGGELANSKSVFRAVAAGNGIPIPPGRVVRDRAAAYDYILPLLDAGSPVILKQDVHGGGYGNEILSPIDGLQGYGALGVTVIADAAQLAGHLDESWTRHTNDGRHPVVVEQYIDNSTPIYIEVLLDDQGTKTVGYGEMRMKPTNNGLVIPPPSADLPAFPGFLDHAARLGDTVRALGYRGSMSVDAIVTPGGEILFNEFNCRIGGSTHIHRIADALLGPGYLNDRVLIARSRCGWPSLTDALAALAEHGLAFDPQTRCGVVIAGDSRGTPGPSGQCLIAAPSAEQAVRTEAALVAALGLDEQ